MAKKMSCWACGGLAAVSVFGAACADTGKDAAKTITVTATDYKFEGLPKSVKAGSKLELTNISTKEIHEMVVERLPDTEKRSVSELDKLPQAEQEAAVEPGLPALVVVAPPNRAAQIGALGDGTLTKKGRYVVSCSIPTGADPAAYLKAAQEAKDGPPARVPGGPPHSTQGMVGELTVT